MTNAPLTTENPSPQPDDPRYTRPACPVIPVILSDCENAPQLPPFLESMTWVDFRKQDPDPLESLIWGITGERGLMR